ncbi:hypothetical protein B484DRAFT_468771 [Ochromonadaceae sp. CCMP2298]|nr:hypothetical protein B484DRAFT_468771 [Ochromonadaceae sp. CCMP2298]
MSGTSDAERVQQLLDSLWEIFQRPELEELLSTSDIRSASDFRRFLEMDGNDLLTGEWTALGTLLPMGPRNRANDRLRSLRTVVGRAATVVVQPSFADSIGIRRWSEPNSSSSSLATPKKPKIGASNTSSSPKGAHTQEKTPAAVAAPAPAPAPQALAPVVPAVPAVPAPAPVVPAPAAVAAEVPAPAAVAAEVPAVPASAAPADKATPSDSAQASRAEELVNQAKRSVDVLNSFANSVVTQARIRDECCSRVCALSDEVDHDVDEFKRAEESATEPTARNDLLVSVQGLQEVVLLMVGSIDQAEGSVRATNGLADQFTRYYSSRVVHHMEALANINPDEHSILSTGVTRAHNRLQPVLAAGDPMIDWEHMRRRKAYLDDKTQELTTTIHELNKQALGLRKR